MAAKNRNHHLEGNEPLKTWVHGNWFIIDAFRTCKCDREQCEFNYQLLLISVERYGLNTYLLINLFIMHRRLCLIVFWMFVHISKEVKLFTFFDNERVKTLVENRLA